MKDSTDTTCHIQGTVTITGGGGDLTMDNNVLASGQTVNQNSFTLTAGERVKPGARLDHERLHHSDDGWHASQ